MDQETAWNDDLRGLYDMARGVRDGMLEDGRPLSGRCEEASGLLADVMSAAGLDPLLVWGEYDHPDGRHPTTGHCWIQSCGLILDPTRSQFDDGPIVVAAGSPQAAPYRFHYGLRIEELELPG